MKHAESYSAFTNEKQEQLCRSSNTKIQPHTNCRREIQTHIPLDTQAMRERKKKVRKNTVTTTMAPLLRHLLLHQIQRRPSLEPLDLLRIERMVQLKRPRLLPIRLRHHQVQLLTGHKLIHQTHNIH